MQGNAFVILILLVMPLNLSAFAQKVSLAAVPPRTNAASSRMLAATATAVDSSTTITQVMERDSLKQLEYWKQHVTSSTSDSPLIWSTREEASAFVDENIDAILLDCDGVLYRGLDVTPEAPVCLENLLEKGKQVFFVTNNASQNRQQLRDKLASLLDCPSLTKEQMISSSYSCAQYLKEQLTHSTRKRVHVIGTEGLCEELTATCFDVSGGPSDNDERTGMSRDELANYDFDGTLGDVDAVVVGLDTEFNYRKLCIANVLLQRNPGALFVATNKDAFDLVGADARHLPGNGALVAALEHASQRTAINVGKPSSVLAGLIQRQHGLDSSRTIMVGDRLDTDIQFGRNGGMVSALVLTGCVSAQDLIALGEGTEEEPLPDVILPYFGLLA